VGSLFPRAQANLAYNIPTTAVGTRKSSSIFMASTFWKHFQLQGISIVDIQVCSQEHFEASVQANLPIADRLRMIAPPRVKVHGFFHPCPRPRSLINGLDLTGHGVPSEPRKQAEKMQSLKPPIVASYELHTGCTSYGRSDQNEIGHPITMRQHDPYQGTIYVASCKQRA
jgi:hypothetical protein